METAIIKKYMGLGVPNITGSSCMGQVWVYVIRTLGFLIIVIRIG